jgi:hypothetical protein
MEWIIGSFVYSIIGSSMAIQKKTQPTVDSFFEALYAFVRLRKPLPKGNPSDNPERK